MSMPPLPTNGQLPAGPTADGTELVQPFPMNVVIWALPNSDVVMMRIATPLGGLHFAFTADQAIQIGGQLRQRGKATKTGLALPPGLRLPDDE